MKRSDFSFQLPDELIARFPTDRRTDSRLLALDLATGGLKDYHFYELPPLLRAGDLLVFNNTRVIPARLFGHKASGGKIEILIERILGENECLAHVRASKAPKSGSRLVIADGAEFDVMGRSGDLFHLVSRQQSVLDVLNDLGHMPLPPYIDRADQQLDQQRYQTVYAQHPGAVAAPTAGLHFDEALLDQLQQQQINTAFVTLHVGAGTFQPVRCDDIRDHQMHSEWLQVSESVVDQVAQTKAKGGRVIAVGTTAVRCLETAARKSSGSVLAPFAGDTNIFIYPGYEFQVVDGLITNFHLPESTLIMLVAALAGRERVLAAYQHAIAQNYRFYSYGDAMLLI